MPVESTSVFYMSWFDTGPVPGTQEQQLGKGGKKKKVNEGIMSEVRTRRNISRAKQAQLQLKSEIYC